VGMTALVLMIPLAATSTAGSIRRLGGARWQWLRRRVARLSPSPRPSPQGGEGA
jgi:sulfoxide reductase heme-binding subunit YedZ